MTIQKLKDLVKAGDEFTQGVCHDGAAILKNGERLTIEEILNLLNSTSAIIEKYERMEEALQNIMCDAQEFGFHGGDEIVKRIMNTAKQALEKG